MLRRWLWIVLGLGTLGPSAYYGWTAWSHRVLLNQARRDVEDGRFAEARPALVRLASQWPREAEVSYLLGICERELGRPDEAMAAWSHIAIDSNYSSRAAVLQARLALERHRFAEAEAILPRALDVPGPEAIEARQSLALIDKLQGRVDEVARLFRDGFDRMPNPVATLRELWDLEQAPYPVEPSRHALAQAHDAAPEDDRVWLGLAHLATRTGDFAEADRWLTACEKKRPDDPAVWLARIDWARASGDDAEAYRALVHLKDHTMPPEWVLRLGIWFASRRGDTSTERATLESLIALDPHDLLASERLAELLFEAGEPQRAAELRERKTRLERDRERYRDLLFFDPDPIARAEELSRLAEAIGLRFEAKTWLALAIRRDPGNDRARAAYARLDAIPPALATPVVPTPATLLTQVRPPSKGAALASKDSRTVPPPSFRDDAEAAGLRFRFEPGRLKGRRLPETMGGGLALLDADSDGWLDVFVVQGGAFPPGPMAPNGDRLFRNRGNGQFEDVTVGAGLSGLPGGYGFGVTAGDVDNDGDPDLFVTRWRSYALYLNDGTGRFDDATESWGLSGDRDWPSSAALADLDNDGDLDLYVCHYLEWSFEHPQGNRPDRAPDTTRYNNPLNYVALMDHLFRNDGGRFVDVSEASGLSAIDRDGRGLGVLAADFDDDGRLDLYVANDLTANFLLRNRGDLRFEDVAAISGVAGSAEGSYQGSMGLAAGDADQDGRLDLAVTNFYGDGMAFYQGLGSGVFADHTASAGLLVSTRYKVGWGIAFLDADNDGRLDLALTNGHLDDPGSGLPYAMPSQLFQGRPGGRFEEVNDRAGEVWRLPRVGRALVEGDLDNDGRRDVLVVSHDLPLAYLRNQTEPRGHFLTLRLEGTSSNRDAIGATVTVESGGRRWISRRLGGGGYQSSGDPRLHFGLGALERVESLEVKWPSGRVDRYRDLAADTGYRLREGDPAPAPLAGFDGSRTIPGD